MYQICGKCGRPFVSSHPPDTICQRFACQHGEDTDILRREGLTNREIAELFGVSTRTVRRYFERGRTQ
jgi:IS30 family transposase